MDSRCEQRCKKIPGPAQQNIFFSKLERLSLADAPILVSYLRVRLGNWNIEWSSFKDSTQVGYSLLRTRVEVADSYEHASLLLSDTIYRCKFFIVQAPGGGGGQFAEIESCT